MLTYADFSFETLTTLTFCPKRWCQRETLIFGTSDQDGGSSPEVPKFQWPKRWHVLLVWDRGVWSDMEVLDWTIRCKFRILKLHSDEAPIFAPWKRCNGAAASFCTLQTLQWCRIRCGSAKRYQLPCLMMSGMLHYAKNISWATKKMIPLGLKRWSKRIFEES